MPYTPQQWHDNSTAAPYGPINGDRLNHIEAGIVSAAAGAYNVVDYGAVGDGVADDTAAFKAMLAAAAAAGAQYEAGATAVVPNPSVGYLITSTLTVGSTGKGNVLIQGVGQNPLIIYSGTGACFNVPGTADPNTRDRVSFRNLVLRASVRRAAGTVGVQMAYGNIHSSQSLRIKQFETAMILNNCADYHGVHNEFFDCKVGLRLQDACGASVFHAAQFDANETGLIVEGFLNQLEFVAGDFTTESSSGSSGGCVQITGLANNVAFRGCGFYAASSPTTGATCLVGGASSNVLFDNCNFEGHSSGIASPAAIKATTVTNMIVRGGSTKNHSTSSFIVNTGAAGVLIDHATMAEATKITGSAQNIPVVMDQQAGQSALLGGDLVLYGGIRLGNGITAALGSLIRSGASDPNGAIIGSVGDAWLRTNGGAGTTWYVKESGAATNTGWVAK